MDVAFFAIPIESHQNPICCLVLTTTEKKASPYKIKLPCLYYNDQNDRIATWISKYKADNGLSQFDLSDIEKYNSIIQGFIVSSNPTAIEKTKSNINMVDQREPGVVLNAGYMVEFLEYINAPKQFYVARDLELEGPLIELAAILRKCPDDETRQKMKISIFNNMLMKPENDMTKFVRQIKSVVETEYVDDFIEEQIELAKQVEEIIPKQVTDTKTIQENIRQNEQIKEQLSHSMDRVVTKVKRTETRNKPALMLDKSIISVENIDVLRAHLDNIENYIIQKLN